MAPLHSPPVLRIQEWEQLAMRLASSIVLIVAVTAAVGACHPREHSEQTGQSGQGVLTQERHGGQGIRRICADDIAKYCQNEDRKKRCLRQNMDKLSADCRAALEAARARGREKDNNSNSNDKSD